MLRYLPDGRLDPSFGSGGWVITDLGGMDKAGAIVLQADGKLVVAGSSGDYGMVLARYLPDGNLDPRFGVGGLAASGFGGGASGLVPQPDGKLVAAGSSEGDITLVRFLPNGSLDRRFGIGGKAYTSLSTQVKYAYGGALARQPDGKLVAAGSFDSCYADEACVSQIVLARFLD